MEQPWKQVETSLERSHAAIPRPAREHRERSPAPSAIGVMHGGQLVVILGELNHSRRAIGVHGHSEMSF